MRKISSWPPTVFMLLVLTIHPSQAAESVTVKDTLLRMLLLPTESVINHCHVNAPETDQAVQAGYTNYMKAYDVASKKWISTLEQTDAKIVFQGSEQFLKGYLEEVLDEIKKSDPVMFCSGLANRWGSITPESLEKTLTNTYARHGAWAREQQSQASRPKKDDPSNPSVEPIR